MELTAYQSWLDANRIRLRDYEAWEVARVALACGFTLREVTPHTVDWYTRARRRLQLWENEFFEHWVALWCYERGDDWEDDLNGRYPNV